MTSQSCRKSINGLMFFYIGHNISTLNFRIKKSPADFIEGYLLEKRVSTGEPIQKGNCSMVFDKMRLTLGHMGISNYVFI